MVLVLCACPAPTETIIKLDRKSPNFTHGLVVLLPHNASDDIEKCLKNKLRKKVTRRPIFFDSHTFRKVLFPWFEVETAPKTSEELRDLFLQPLVQQRLASIRVHYVISFSSYDLGDDEYSGIFCGGGYGGGGCFGVGTLDEGTRIEAVIWDVRSGIQAAELSAITTGTSVVPALIVPFPFLAYTEGEACEQFASALANLLREPSEDDSPR